ncbi:hypothetical protein D9613_005986 [Agrocybe pediades]|uniref:Protein kinase domain-containing protein n=1 Tax=Agrocybe pediades TaxID=84607 RepID=A0A8H4QTY6_9AGAR|nr:hypothetical protein D9613_005986 [Agrocybe pediades]
MHTAEILTSEPATLRNYLPSNAPWDQVSPKQHPRTLISEVLDEEEEEDRPIGAQPPYGRFKNTTLEEEQRISASLLSYSNSWNGATTYNLRKAPQTIPASASQSPSISASPAAAFLSFFSSPVQNAPKPDDEGQVVAGYTLGSIIGYGSSSIIRRASSSSGAIAAVKIIRRSDLVKAGNAPQARKRLQHEAAVWSSLSHEHILPLFKAVHTTYADYFFTLYCPVGSLFDILKRDGNPALPQDDAGMMLRQVVRGLRYLHEDARYVHRDIKLENILVDDMGVCKIGDFGMSRKIGSFEEEDSDSAEEHEHNPPLQRAVSMAAPSRRHTKANFPLNETLSRHHSTRHRNSTSTVEPAHTLQPGSLPYAAPELLLPQTSDALKPHPSQDIWALGVMLYALLTGSLPFFDSFEPRLQMKILAGNYKVPDGIGRGAERILKGCLDRSVPNRWTIAMVDEVAWGVGWGAEGDSATPTETPNDPLPQSKPSSSRSRSRSKLEDIIVPPENDWQQEEPRPRSSQEAASRRSTSRVQRSLSRAPALSERSLSSRGQSRSISRRPRGFSPVPSRSREPLAPVTVTSPVSAASSKDGLDDILHGSALLASPSPIQRGRRQSKFSHNTSRSPSPSLVPTTPLDGASVIPPDNLLEQPDDLQLDGESSRGRAPIRSALGSDRLKHSNLRFEERLDDWTSQQSELEIGRDESSGISSIRSEDGLQGGEWAEVQSAVDSEFNRRQRPYSASPIASDRLQPTTKNVTEPFLSHSPPLSSAATNLLALRSRSAENGR